MTGKRIAALLAAVLACSLGVNVVLVVQTIEFYKREQALRLDPLHGAAFAARNQAIGPRTPGTARILFAGDSRVELWRPLPDVPGAELINSGRSADTTQQVLLRLDRDVLAHQPDVVVVEAGINDLKSMGLFPNDRAAIQARCEANLRAIADRLVEKDVVVVLLPILPTGPISWARGLVWSAQSHRAIAEINENMKRWAGGPVHYVDCVPAMAVQDRMKPEFASDAFHLTGAGYAALNAALEPLLTTLCTGKGPQE